MAATAFSALNALLIHALGVTDSDVGIINGMEAQGLLCKSIAYKPTREKKTHKNHRGHDWAHVMSNPQLVLTVDADITLMAGPLAAKHPGEPIHKSYVADFYTAVAHRFQTTTGYFIYDEVDTNSPQGDFNTGKFTLTWFAPVVGASQLVAAPSAPA